MSRLRLLFIALVITALIQTLYYYPRLPDVVASHFDGPGAADAWSGKDGFFVLYLAMVLLVASVFYLLPRWLENRTNFGSGIPHREYWLAAERIDATRRFFRRQLLLMGVIHLALAIFVMQLTIEANFSVEPRLDRSIYWALGLYAAILVIWLIHFYRHLRRP